MAHPVPGPRRPGRGRPADGRLTNADVAPHLVEWVANAVVLRDAWLYNRRRGGPAVGADGVRFAHATGRVLWDVCRKIGRDIRSGSYWPDTERVVQVPKGGNRGARPICVQTAVDRTVQRAAYSVLAPLLDPTFSGSSFGYRPGLDRRHALAFAERLTFAEGRAAWAVADLSDAFGSVPVNRLLDLVRSRFPGPGLVGFLGRVLGPPRGGQRPRGLRQGGSLSPLLMNLYFDHFVDRPWREAHPDVPLVRYADDLLVLARDPEEAGRHLDELRLLIRPAGLTLKPPRAAPVRDLTAGRDAAWLGFLLRKNEDRLSVRPARSAYVRLERHVRRVLAGADGWCAADAAVRGWVRQMGPTWGNVRRASALAKVAAACAAAGFDEYPGPDELREAWAAGHRDWLALRNRAAHAAAG